MSTADGRPTPRKRVRRALEHRDVDRVPRGELLVEEEFLDLLYPERAGAPWREKMFRLAEEAQLDLIVIRFPPRAGAAELAELEWWAAKTDRFVVALLDGLFWQPTDLLDLPEFLVGLKGENESFRSLIESKTARALRQIEICIGHGAHGCLIGDDIAHNGGPFASPADLEEWIFPGLGELAEAAHGHGSVALFHSCGNLSSLLDRLMSLGFDGFHGMSACAGNDLSAALERTRGRMALLGGVDVDAWTPEAIRSFCETALGGRSRAGGYVLGSSSGLSANTPLESFFALYGGPAPPGGSPCNRLVPGTTRMPR